MDNREKGFERWFEKKLGDLCSFDKGAGRNSVEASLEARLEALCFVDKRAGLNTVWRKLLLVKFKTRSKIIFILETPVKEEYYEKKPG